MKGKKSNEQVAQLQSQLARALADYDNLQKRVERDSIELYKNASNRIVKRLLGILDMLDAAQAHLNDAGLAIVSNEFRQLLKEEGYNEIKPELGQAFDESNSEAIEVVDTNEENKNNTIAEVIVNGWEQEGGLVVRYAKVKVYKYKQN